jgi:hypothetical protein
MPLSEPVIQTWSIVQCLKPEDDPAVPQGCVRASFQGVMGQLSLLVSDPDRVAELVAVWDPYKAANDAAANDLTGQTPYPTPPLYTVTLTQN